MLDSVSSSVAVPLIRAYQSQNALVTVTSRVSNSIPQRVIITLWLLKLGIMANVWLPTILKLMVARAPVSVDLVYYKYIKVDLIRVISKQ